MKKSDLCCEKCLYAAPHEELMLCRRESPRGSEVKSRHDVILGFKVEKNYWCGKGEWRIWYENNRDSKSLKIYHWGSCDVEKKNET